MKSILHLLITIGVMADVVPKSVERYLSHIKVVDACTQIAEPFKIDALGIKGRGFEVQKAIRACEKSFKEHPSDPHVAFLLARSYSKGAIDVKGMDLPKSTLLSTPMFNGPKPKYDKGYPLAKASCLAGDPGGCGLLGWYYYRSIIKSRHSNMKAFLLWRWACSEGNMQACQNLSVLIEGARRYIPKDNKSEYLYSLEACMSGWYPHACEDISEWMYLKKFKENDLVTYVNYKACESGFDNACYFLKKQIREQNSTRSEDALLWIMKDSCNKGHAKPCERVGDIYAQKPENRINNLMASTFYELACAYGAEHFACWNAGIYKINKMDGVIRNVDLGLKYLKKSCYVGRNSFACYDLAIFYLDTDDKKYKNREEGLKVMKRSCVLGNGWAEGRGCYEGIESCCTKEIKMKIKKMKMEAKKK